MDQFINPTTGAATGTQVLTPKASGKELRVDDLYFGAGTKSSGLTEEYKTDSTIFEQVLPLNSINLNRLTPFQPATAYFRVVEAPKFMNLVFPELTSTFIKILESGMSAFDGIQDETVEFGTVENGGEAHSFEVLTEVTGETKSVTITLGSEKAGLIMSKYEQAWVYGVKDKYTKRSTYYGADLEFGDGNHTMTGVYFVTDRKGTGIEYAALVLNMMPKTLHKAFLNWKRGESAPQELQLEFTAQVIDRNIFVTRMAKDYLDIINRRISILSQNYDVTNTEKYDVKGFSEARSNLVTMTATGAANNAVGQALSGATDTADAWKDQVGNISAGFL